MHASPPSQPFKPSFATPTIPRVRKAQGKASTNQAQHSPNDRPFVPPLALARPTRARVPDDTTRGSAQDRAQARKLRRGDEAAGGRHELGWSDELAVIRFRMFF